MGYWTQGSNFYFQITKTVLAASRCKANVIKCKPIRLYYVICTLRQTLYILLSLCFLSASTKVDTVHLNLLNICGLLTSYIIVRSTRFWWTRQEAVHHLIRSSGPLALLWFIQCNWFRIYHTKITFSSFLTFLNQIFVLLPKLVYERNI